MRNTSFSRVPSRSESAPLPQTFLRGGERRLEPRVVRCDRYHTAGHRLRRDHPERLRREGRNKKGTRMRQEEPVLLGGEVTRENDRTGEVEPFAEAQVVVECTFASQFIQKGKDGRERRVRQRIAAVAILADVPQPPYIPSMQRLEHQLEHSPQLSETYHHEARLRVLPHYEQHCRQNALQTFCLEEFP